ncbi:hypothetical protein ACEWPN_23545 [Yoonia sp. R2-816]
MYQQNLAQIRRKNYLALLDPFLAAEFAKITDPPVGFGARILATVRGYRAARQALFEATGVTDPGSGQPDFAVLADRKLPSTQP